MGQRQERERESERDGVRVRGEVTGRERIYTYREREGGREKETVCVTEAESKNLVCVNFAPGL